MIGVKEEYNMCLFPLKVVEIICQFIQRYIFIPIIQLETPLFRVMVEAYLEAVSDFLPHMTYDIQMFFVKRVIGVPGYQYDVDLSKEVLCRPLLTIEDMKEVQQTYSQIPGYEHVNVSFTDGVPLLEINRNEHFAIGAVNQQHDITDKLDNMDSNQNIMGKYTDLNEKNNLSPLHKLLDLSSSDQLNVKFTDINKDWHEYLNDKEFYKLSKHDQLVTKWRSRMVKFYEYNFGRYVLESGLNVVLIMMRRYNDSKKGAQV